MHNGTSYETRARHMGSSKWADIAVYHEKQRVHDGTANSFIPFWARVGFSASYIPRRGVKEEIETHGGVLRVPSGLPILYACHAYALTSSPPQRRSSGRVPWAWKRLLLSTS